MIQNKDYKNDEDDIYNEYSQDDDEDDIYEASMHLASLLPSESNLIHNSDCLNSDIDDDDDFSQESLRISKKKDPWVDDCFSLPPLDDLKHFYID